MRLKDVHCPSCTIVNYYDYSFMKDGQPFIHYCTFCRQELYEGKANWVGLE